MKRLIAAILLLLVLSTAAEAEWVICKPDSYVNVRRSPGKHAAEIGWFELGAEVTTTGRTKNGFAECIDLNFEESCGWIFAGYLVDEKPEAMEKGGELFRCCANHQTALRRWVNGPRRAWATDKTTFKVYAMSAEWALTSKGFIRTEFIEREAVLQ